ncbi:hypothetical protein H8S20_02495 [Clostridium sp. NSJ-6]|uniref:Uncharacterized protein n=1 Tax=Clostridium hominis TaxID=2763036 RepID=A0ABR7DA45_9CLOT|nr:hypothetical protein [Clostridium hominis]MBC5627753.1 hypothetical protein [Clostridium hominis]MDU2672990.1 hypothetical protein [Clostridium sp.]
MKISKKVIGLTLGATLMFGAGTMVANAKVNNMSYNRAALGYTQLSSQNDNYNDNSNYNYDDEEFFRDMYNHCHGNRSENTGYRNGMMNNSYNMMNY